MAKIKLCMFRSYDHGGSCFVNPIMVQAIIPVWEAGAKPEGKPVYTRIMLVGGEVRVTDSVSEVIEATTGVEL